MCGWLKLGLFLCLYFKFKLWLKLIVWVNFFLKLIIKGVGWFFGLLVLERVEVVLGCKSFVELFCVRL